MKKFKNKIFYLYSFLIYLVLALITFVLSSQFLEPDVRSFLVSKFSANQPGLDTTIEVVVDDYSKEVYPDWNSHTYTELVDFFYAYAKPKVVGLDFFKPNNDEKYAKILSDSDNLVAIFIPKTDFQEVPEDEKNFMSDFQKKYSLNVISDFVKPDTDVNGVTEFSPAKMLGSAIIKKDNTTNKVFSSINVLKIEDSYYPSLPFRMYLYANNTNDVLIDKDYIVVPKTGLKIPYSRIENGMIANNIRFYQRLEYKAKDKGLTSDSSHVVIPAYQVIDSYRHLKNDGKLQKGDIDPKFFDNKVVFVGINQSGPYRDIIATPMADRHPGVDIQATIFDNLTGSEFLYNASPLVNFIIIALLSLLTFILILRLKFGKSLTILLFIDLAFVFLVLVSAFYYYIINLSGALSVQLVTLVFGYSFKFITENRNKEKIKQAMGKYLSQDIMKNVVSNIDDLKLGGKRAVVTVLFSDIRGFTSMSEKMSAEEVSMILNEYFAEMEPIISKYNGVINKFIGDAVMALFGEPIQDDNHPQNAVKCAYEMLKKVEYLREKWLFEGKPKFEIGVGINTGEVFIGNIGTENRMEYTVIGDTVNLASRIESYNKVYKTNLLVSSSTYEYIKEIADVIKINEVQIRGKSKKMNIYEVLRIDRN